MVTRSTRCYGESVLPFEIIGGWRAKGWPPLP